MDLLGLVGRPIGLGLRVAETALELSVGAAKLIGGAVGIGGNGQPDTEERWSVATEERPDPARRNGDSGVATVAEPEPTPFPEPGPKNYDPTPIAPDAPSPVKTPEEAASDEPELVAEFAEEGAEDGAGAELHIEEPWEGYAQLKAAEVIRSLGEASPTAVAAVQLYEATHRNRRSVLQAAERRLRDGA